MKSNGLTSGIMIVINNDMTAFFDCDDTLVLWDNPNDGTEKIYIKNELGNELPVWPHTRHIEKLRQHHLRGHYVVVWSAGGHAWCEDVVNQLNLESYVDLIICKPQWAWDDLTPNEFIRRCYIKPGEKDEATRKA